MVGYCREVLFESIKYLKNHLAVLHKNRQRILFLLEHIDDPEEIIALQLEYKRLLVTIANEEAVLRSRKEEYIQSFPLNLNGGMA